ncbi:type I-F CRISPR-associated protein Cas7f/Csy3, partial [Testudinibacter sp. TR-2022]
SVFRQPSTKNDFYTLFENWINKKNILSEDQKHYVIAMLLRGGVFGSK